eukprot:TRINITY_DN2101_c0_g1_i2.p1 TRINITY_DN2101_c0_g1~~TRINITY_DN2101_c0_g1_i2.p1  ORF type:complete len:1032 (+),score=321.33 TRINITY_DN2101_c0_g1_i2:76-3096(+)
MAAGAAANAPPLSGMWQSEDMELVNISLPRDMLETAVRKVGQLGCVEFRCMADESTRRRGEYQQQVRLCESIERRLRYFDDLFPRFPPASPSHTASPGGGARDELLERDAPSEAPPLGVPSFSGRGGGQHWSESPDALHALDDRMQAEERQLREEGMGLVPTLEHGIDRFCTDVEHLACLGAMADEGSDLNRLEEDALSTSTFQELHEFDESEQQQRPLHGASAPRPLDMFRGELVGTVAADRVLLFRRLTSRVTKGNAIVSIQPIDVCRESALHSSPADVAMFTSVSMLDERVHEERAAFRVMFTAEAAQWRLHKLCATIGARLFAASPVVALSAAVSHEESARLRRETLARLGVAALPTSRQEIRANIDRMRDRIQSDIALLRRTHAQIRRELATLRGHQRMRKQYVLKEKAMYHVLNSMSVSGDHVESSCWVPARFVYRLRAVCDDMRDSGGRRPLLRNMPLSEALAADGGLESPPTFYDTNVITATFQGIVDSYGVPRYKEVNPAVWTIITFPWLFGVMYGDVGHGLMITIAAALCIIYEPVIMRHELNEIAEMIFGARYLLLMMGIFAVYLGLLYNDTFGLMLEYSPSRYRWPSGWEELNHDNGSNAPACFTGDVPLACGACDHGSYKMFNFTSSIGTVGICGCPLPPAGQGAAAPCATPPGYPQEYGIGLMSPADGPTPFGMDAAWAEADNKLDFFNSFKMKNAVILGVVQMLGGLALSLCNHVNRRDRNHILFGFIPEVVFLTFTFGYMCVMIIVKWTTEWQNSNTAPNVLESMTNFFLSPGTYPEFSQEKCSLNSSDPEYSCSGYELLYATQRGTQTAFLLIAFLVLPLMLFPIPYLELRRKRELERSGEIEAALKVDMQEVVIKQVIHTIEYVLGCVSNTASYLRLWALSLAHAELSEVFWKFAFMTFLEQAEGGGGGVLMYLGFGAWLSVTVGVLIVMEALSAFLHALRLHWVEFQNKFYAGDGRKFAPLSFAELLSAASLSEESGDASELHSVTV